LVAGIAGSNPDEGMDMFLLCLFVLVSCVGIGLCDGLITGPGESYRVSKSVLLRNLSTEEDKVQVEAVVPQEKKTVKYVVTFEVRPGFLNII
jgi:hypothetical protein